MTRQQIEDVFARRDQTIARRDAFAVSAVYSVDAVVESPTAGGDVHGREAIGGITRAWVSGFPDVKFTRQSLIIDGDRAAWIGEVTGTDTGGFMGLEATGKPFRVPMIMLCTLADGFIVRERRIYDFTGMLIQIGVLKKKSL